MTMNKRHSTLLTRAAYSFLLGLAIFILGAVVENTLRRKGITGLWQWIDNIATALLSGLLVFWYEHRTYRNMQRKLHMIGAMNHHVRNALQSITYSPYSPSQAVQIKVIRDSVMRIEWALREILPNETDDPDFSAGPVGQK
jgi:hypothetical protein